MGDLQVDTLGVDVKATMRGDMFVSSFSRLGPTQVQGLFGVRDAASFESNLSAVGSIQGSSLTDGTATLTGGALTGLTGLTVGALCREGRSPTARPR